jgi:hypothetical protein
MPEVDPRISGVSRPRLPPNTRTWLRAAPIDGGPGAALSPRRPSTDHRPLHVLGRPSETRREVVEKDWTLRASHDSGRVDDEYWKPVSQHVHPFDLPQGMTRLLPQTECTSGLSPLNWISPQPRNRDYRSDD